MDALDGDGKALLEHGEIIARRYAARVGADVAEEVRAEAVVRAVRSPAPDGRIEPWLERIYKNLLIDRWRRAEPVYVDVNEVDALDTTNAGAPTPEDHLLARERRRLVRASLRQLPPQARQVLLSRYYGELDEEASARRLGIARATVRTRVHRALARLRSRLGDLRAFLPCLPPSFGRGTELLGMIAAAPLLAAALVIGVASSPETRVIAAPAAIASFAPSSFVPLSFVPLSFVPTEVHPAARTPAVLPPHVHAAKKQSTVAPRPAEDLEPPALAVAEILWPETLDVMTEPERPAPPRLLETPTTFAHQIEMMVDNDL